MRKQIPIFMLMIITMILIISGNTEVYGAHVSGCTGTGTRQTYSQNGSSSTHKVDTYCTKCSGWLYSSTGSHSFGGWTNDGLGKTHSKTCSKCSYKSSSSHSYGGYKYYNSSTHRSTCSTCGSYYSGSHSYTGTTTTAATCTSSGVKTYKCGTCGDSYTDTISALGHSGGSAATCTSAQTCTRCGVTITSALGHTGGTATCIALKKCTRCGTGYGSYASHSYTVNNGSCNGKKCSTSGCTSTTGYTSHSWSGWSYSDNSQHKRTCSRSGCRNSTEYASHSVGTAATCTTPAKCSGCGNTYGGTDPNNHTGGTATCWAKAVCTRCHYSYGGYATHSYGGYTVDIEPTCTKTGSKSKHCVNFANCGDAINVQSIPATGHTSNGYWYKTNDTQHHTKCSTCSTNFGHENHWVGTAATCTTAKKCAKCSEYYGSPNGHTPGAAATCTSPQTCTTCGTTLANALGHSAGAAATCIAAQTCTRCGATITAALGHNYTGSYTKYDEAQHRRKCSRCTTYQYGNHSGGTATCTAAKVCSTCSSSYGSALGHSPGAAATCTTAQTCTRSGCGTTITAALGHNYTGSYTKYDETQHRRKCSRCTSYEYGNHTGGTATCTAAKVCSTCNSSYGNAKGHTWTTSYTQYTATQHYTQKCSTCGTTQSAANHTWNTSHKCTACSYQGSHSWSTSYTSNGASQHYTQKCGCGALGTLANHTWNTSHKCTACSYQGTHSWSTSYTQSTATQHYTQKCGCGAVQTLANHTWNTSHKCTACSYQGTHSWSSWSVTTAETCSAKGSEKRTCGCGASQTQERAIDSTKHNYSKTCPTCSTANVICSYNSSHVKSHTCDNAAPTINSFTASSSTYTGGNITLTGKATDTQSGIVGYAFTTSSSVPSSWTTITATKTQITQTTTVTNAGTYYFWVKDGAGYTSNSSLTIGKASITPVVSMSGYNYAGTKSTPSISGNPGGGTVTYYYSTSNKNSGGTAWSSVTSATSLSVGTYYMYATVTETSNYKAGTSAAVAFDVSNGALGGSVTITGTNTYNQTLTANTSNITPSGCAFTYQWYSNSTNSTSGGSAISGATGSTYKVGSGLAGKYIYVEVTASKANYANKTFKDITDSSNTTATVSKAAITPVISMTGYQYATTKTSPTLTSGNPGSGTITYYYSTSNKNSGGTAWTNVTSATSLSVGTYYMYATVAETTNYKAGTSAAVAFTISNGAISGSVTITGTNTYGQTLTAKINNLVPSDATLTYQWWRSTSATATSGTAISGATGSTYTVGNGLAGEYIGVTVTVTRSNYTSKTFTDITDSSNGTATVNKAAITPVISMTGYAHGTTKKEPTLTSGNPGGGAITYYYSTSNTNSGGTAWTKVTSSTSLNVGTYYMYATVAETTNYKAGTSAAVAFTISNGTISGNVTITGTNTYNQTLTANTSAISPSGCSFTYQWYTNSTNSTSGGSAIEGATANTYKVGSGLAEKYIYVVVTASKANYTNNTFTDITDSSNGTATVSKAAITPVISMTGYKYATTKTNPTVTSGNPGSGTVTYYYSTSNTNSGGTAWTNVADAKTLDVGTYYMYATVSETTNYKAGTSSAVKFEITDGTISANVSISGTLTYGSTLTANVSNLVPSDTTLAYQWYANTTNSATGGTAISGATGQTYQMTSDAFDKYVYVVVTASRKNYTTKQISSSATSSKIAQRPITVTSASSQKVYDGVALTNSNFTVSETLPFSHKVSATTTGTITNVGTTSNTLLLANVKVLSSTNVDVTQYYKVTIVEGTLKVINAPIEGYVTITGTNTYGQTLTVNTSNITPTGCNLTYQWWTSASSTATSGTPISGATSNTYTIGSGLAGKYIGVTVNASKANYTSNTFTDITDSNNGTAVVDKAAITPVITMTGYQYATTKNNPSLVSGNPGNGTVTFYYNKNNSTSGGTAWTNVADAKTLDVGTYYMYAKVAETTDYKAGTSATVAFTITEGTITANLTITGKNTFGETLTASISNLIPADATLAYQWWYATSATATNGTAISGATSSTYKIGSGLAGKYIGVTVTASRKNYTTKILTDITDAGNNTTATVEKATGIITLTATEYNVSKGTNVTVTYSYNGDGTISVVSSNTNVVTTVLTAVENKFIFSAVAAGNITITISAPETADYKGISKTITVRVFDISSVGNVSAVVGETATYSVSLINAYSESTYNYQWQYKTNISDTWHIINGATNALYSVTAKETMNGYSYRCVVKNNDGYSITSNVATLTVGWDISQNGDRSVMAYFVPDPSNINNYVMTVTGTGMMKNFNDYADVPWVDYRNKVSELVIEEGVKNIGNKAFYNFKFIDNITLPSTITYIGRYAFENCINVKGDVTIPQATTTIDLNPFYGAPITQYIVASGNIAYVAKDGVLFDKNITHLLSYPMGATTNSYVVPSTVTNIEPYACAKSQFTTITLPTGLKIIDNRAFEDSKLVELTIPSSVTNINRGAFNNSTALQNIYLLSTSLEVGNEAFTNLKSGSIIYTLSKDVANRFVDGTHYKSEDTNIYYPPTITRHPQDAKSIWGATATFSVEITEGNPTASYQWYKNGIAIEGATSNVYTTPALSAADNGSTYYCLVSNAEYYKNKGLVTSNSATLVVIDGRYSVIRGAEEIYYDSLQLAFDSLEDGETLTVKKNIPAESNAVLSGEKTIIIETNNYFVTFENDATIEIGADSEIIFKGNGNINKVVNDSKAIITNNGTLIVKENIKFSSTYGYVIENTGTATLNDGEYRGAKPICVSGTASSKLIVDGDNVKVIGEGIMTGNDGAITVKGSANLEFVKGTVNASSNVSDVIGILVKENASATITGGTISAASSNSIDKADAVAMKTLAEVTISGDAVLNGSRSGVTLLDTNIGTLHINHGTIIGGQAGIFNNSNATVQITDKDDENVGTAVPVIRGEEFAYISMKDNSQFVFYDGILQSAGKNILYQGSVANTNNFIAQEFVEAIKADVTNDNKIYVGNSTIPPTYVVGHALHLSTMDIGEKTYGVAYLKPYTAPIVNGPRNEIVKLNQSTEFEITVTGGVPAYYTYEWQISTDGGKTWTKIEGAEETKYVTPIITEEMNGNMYRCAVSNGIFTSYSREVKLTIDPDSLAQMPINIIPIGRFTFKNGNVISEVDGEKVVELELVIKSSSPLNELKINDEVVEDLSSDTLMNVGNVMVKKNSYNEIKNEINEVAEYAYSYILTIKTNGVYTATFTDEKNHSGSVTQTIDTFKDVELDVKHLVEEPTLYRNYSVVTFISNRVVKFVSPSIYAEDIKSFGTGEYANKYTLDVYGEMNGVVFTFVDKSGYTKDVIVNIGGNVGKKIRLTSDADNINSISINDAYEIAQKLESKISLATDNKVQNVYGVSNAQVDMFMSRARDVGAAVILSNASVTKSYDAVLPKEMTSGETSKLSTYGMNMISNEYVSAFISASSDDTTLSKADYKYIDILKGSRLGLYKGFSLSGYNISNVAKPYMMMTGNTSATNVENTPGNASFRVTIINK